jgi:hypothetical protein
VSSPREVPTKPTFARGLPGALAPSALSRRHADRPRCPRTRRARGAPSPSRRLSPRNLPALRWRSPSRARSPRPHAGRRATRRADQDRPLHLCGRGLRRHVACAPRVRRASPVAAIARDPGRPRGTGVPARTYRRWKARLDSAARQLVHILAHHDDEDVAKFAGVAGFDATRRELIELFTAGRVLGVHALEDIASALQALERGVRLM